MGTGTIFRRINAPGAEAQNEPLSLSDFNETRSQSKKSGGGGVYSAKYSVCQCSLWQEPIIMDIPVNTITQGGAAMGFHEAVG